MNELPAGWHTAALADLIETVRGVTYGKSQACDSGGDGLLPLLRANNIKSGNLTFDDLVFVPEECVSSTQTLAEGDIVVAMSSGSRSVVGKTAQLTVAWQGSFGAFCGVLRAATGMDARYLYHFTQSRTYRNRVSELAAGVNINNLKPAHFADIPIPVAPLQEQKRIAQKLDALLAQVNTLKARIDAIPANLKKFRLSVFSAASSGNLCGMRNSKAWTNARFGDVILSMSNGIGGPQNKSGKGLPVSRIETIANEYIDFKRIGFIEGVNAQDSVRYKLNHGDVLFSHINSPTHLGKTAVFDNGHLFHGINLMRIIVDKELVLPEFFDYVCKAHRAKGNFSQQAQHAVNQASLNQKKIAEFEISFPPIDEQVEIVRRVKQLLPLADQLETRVSAAQKRVDALTQSLLAKAFRGELVPQDPNDEPASVLLERIRAQRAATPKPKRGRKVATS